MPICSQIASRSEQHWTLPWGSATKIWFPPALATEQTFMRSIQLSSPSDRVMAAALCATSAALRSMFLLNSPITYCRPMPTKDRAITRKQMETRTAMAMKFRR